MFCTFTIRLTVCCSIGNQTLSTKNRAYQVLHQCLVLFALFTFCLCFVATSWILRAYLTWTFCFFRCVVCWNPLSWQVVSALNRLGAIFMTFSGAEHWRVFICSGGMRYLFAYFFLTPTGRVHLKREHFMFEYLNCPSHTFTHNMKLKCSASHSLTGLLCFLPAFWTSCRCCVYLY